MRLSKISVIALTFMIAGTLLTGCGQKPSANNESGKEPEKAVVSSEKTDEKKAWGPERSTFTWKEPAGYVSFDSITDNPNLGDERNFVRISTEPDGSHAEDDVKVEPGKDYTVYIYYDNDAAPNLGEKGLAKDVRLSMAIPEVLAAGKFAQVKGTIHSSNAEPNDVFDCAFFTSDEQVYLRYVKNSAVIYNAGSANGTALDDDLLFSEEGAPISFSKDAPGEIPCSDGDSDGYVLFQVHVDQPGFYMEETASTDGSDPSEEVIETAPGKEIDMKMRYHNTGTTEQKDVTFYVELPDGVELVPDSVYLKIPSGEGKQSDAVASNGLNIGTFEPGDEAVLTYKVKIDDDSKIFPAGDTVIYAKASCATANGTANDAVKITVKR